MRNAPISHDYYNYKNFLDMPSIMQVESYYKHLHILINTFIRIRLE